MSTPQNCLITGGCGFLGSNIAAHFLSKGSRVVIIDALFRAGSEANLAWLKSLEADQAVVFVQGDLAEQATVEAVFRQHGPFDYVCHLGGQVAMTTSLSDPRRDMLTNVVGTFNVLEAVRNFSPEALVAYSSTNKVYGDLERITYTEGPTRYSALGHPDGFDESLPLDFSTPYGCSKGAADQYVRDWSRLFGIKTVVFRHSSIYGGRQFSTFDQGWIGWFCLKALEQKRALDAAMAPVPFTIAGTGKQVRDVLYADDLIALYHAAYDKRDRVSGEIFNIGGGISNSLSLLELFDLLADLNGIPELLFERLPRRQSDQDFFVADIGKARKMLGWSPLVQSADGVRRMVEWVHASN